MVLYIYNETVSYARLVCEILKVGTPIKKNKKKSTNHVKHQLLIFFVA